MKLMNPVALPSYRRGEKRIPSVICHATVDSRSYGKDERAPLPG